MTNKLLLTLLLITITFSSLSTPTRPDQVGRNPNPTTPPAAAAAAKGRGGGGGRGDNGGGGFFGPGFGIPGFDNNNWGPGGVGGGYGYGIGGPSGGYSRGGTIVPSVVCQQRGPCFMKKLTCPAKCFSSFHRSGKGYGGGGGGGGCTMDCKKKCIAYC